MNWLLLVVGLILIGFMVLGYVRGFIKSIFSLFSFVVILVIACFLAPKVDTFLIKNTQVYPLVEQHCIAHYEKKAMEASNSKDLVEPKSEEEAISTLKIQYPKQLQNKFKQKLAKQASNIGIYERIGKTTANIVVGASVLILTIILLWMVVRVVEGILDLVSKLPILNGVNRILGIFVGLAGGILFIWALGFFLSLCSTTEIGKNLLSLVSESPVLNALYQNNGIIFLWEVFF